MPHRAEMPQSDSKASSAVKRIEAIGEHVYVKVGKRWTRQHCPRSWVQKPKEPKQRVCFGQDGDSRAATRATARARTEAKQALENERNAKLNRESEVQKHIIVPSGERWLCTTCNNSVVRTEKARFSRDPCQGAAKRKGVRKKRTRQALRTVESSEDDNAESRQQLS